MWSCAGPTDKTADTGVERSGSIRCRVRSCSACWGGQSGGSSTVAETGSVVCLDLETTGLRGGAGTFAFVVGFGWFEQGAFRTHQFVLSQLSAERWMLQAAAEVVGRATTLLTFNGKSFDAPVMETRWALHRLPSPLEALRHVDLLHPARRLWRSDEGRLASLERAVLGLRRVDDVPGADVLVATVNFPFVATENRTL